MSLAADALQPTFVRGLFSLRGRALVANLPDIITSARKAGFDLDFVNSDYVRIDFRDPIFVADAIGGDASRFAIAAFVSLGGFRREVQPRLQHWFLNEKSGFPFRTPAFCSVSRGQRRLGEKEYRAPSVTPGVALRPRTQALLPR